MKLKRTIHRKFKKKGKGKACNNAARSPLVKEGMVDKCTKYMRLFYWSYRVIQLITGNGNDLIGKGLLLLLLKEVLKELFKIDMN